MFEGAKAFNQDISGWDMSLVTNTALMFNRDNPNLRRKMPAGVAESLERDVAARDLAIAKAKAERVRLAAERLADRKRLTAERLAYNKSLEESLTTIDHGDGSKTLYDGSRRVLTKYVDGSFHFYGEPKDYSSYKLDDDDPVDDLVERIEYADGVVDFYEVHRFNNAPDWMHSRMFRTDYAGRREYVWDRETALKYDRLRRPLDSYDVYVLVRRRVSINGHHTYYDESGQQQVPDDFRPK